LGLVGDVTRSRFNMTPELRDDLLQAGGILVGEQEVATRRELTGHGGTHSRGRTDYDVRHPQLPRV
jgi:hypothetical protein